MKIYTYVIAVLASAAPMIAVSDGSQGSQGPMGYSGYYNPQGRPQQQWNNQHQDFNPYRQQQQNGQYNSPQGQETVSNEANTGNADEKTILPLPMGWIELVDPASGRLYYYSAVKRVTTWTRPVPEPEPEVQETLVESEQTDPVKEEETFQYHPSSHAEPNSELEPGPKADPEFISETEGDKQNNDEIRPDDTDLVNDEEHKMEEQSQLDDEHLRPDDQFRTYTQHHQQPHGWIHSGPETSSLTYEQRNSSQSQAHHAAPQHQIPDQANSQSQQWNQLHQQHRDLPPQQPNRPPQQQQYHIPPQSLQLNQKQVHPTEFTKEVDLPKQDQVLQAQPPPQQNEPQQQQSMQQQRPRSGSQPGPGQQQPFYHGPPDFGDKSFPPHQQTPPWGLGEYHPQRLPRQSQEEPASPSEQGQGQQPHLHGQYGGHYGNQYGNQFGPQYSHYGGPQRYAQPPRPGYVQQKGTGTGGQLAAQSDQASGVVKNAIGNVWQGVLGFGNRTRTVVETAKDTAVDTATQAGQTISSSGAGLWGRARSSVESLGKTMFEGGDEKKTGDYSLSQYGVPPAPGQGQQQGYLPHNYDGPSGYRLPGPREIVTNPHQGQGMGHQGHPLQSHWGNPQQGLPHPQQGLPHPQQGLPRQQQGLPGSVQQQWQQQGPVGSPQKQGPVGSPQKQGQPQNYSRYGQQPMQGYGDQYPSHLQQQSHDGGESQLPQREQRPPHGEENEPENHPGWSGY